MNRLFAIGNTQTNQPQLTLMDVMVFWLFAKKIRQNVLLICTSFDHSHCVFHTCAKTQSGSDNLCAQGNPDKSASSDYEVSLICKESQLCITHCGSVGHSHCICNYCDKLIANDNKDSFYCDEHLKVVNEKKRILLEFLKRHGTVPDGFVVTA